MRRLNSGVVAAIAAALLFGAGTPVAKLILTQTSPWLLAALLYLGSGVGLWLLRRMRRSPSVRLARADWGWLAGAVIAGGMVGPVLLMVGLTRTPASTASLLLNAEGVFTALLAWFVFKEGFDRRIALGMLSIFAGSLILSWPQSMRFAQVLPALAIVGACLAWAIDNNLTRRVSLNDGTFIAMTKGLAAGSTNLLLAILVGAKWPSLAAVGGAAALGFVSYGASLTLFVIALRHLGTARTGAYFSVAPFFGAVLAILLLGEPVTLSLIVAGAFMTVGVLLHLTEKHSHTHTHAVIAHSHEHQHGTGDQHHLHSHNEPLQDNGAHAHWHRHLPITHAHRHFPDSHHQHSH